ncbi:hypothetical protein LY90DRAFT_512645 [Neocallimastix californiae]|uniref:Uncharacterized protein n=1 Tax=Neocallimastix californiae TaxID=1754190 RepID=A0A1Y2B6E8_9FUNG|nr:hypothetical protein LY90DRAFT_512645 [Neocallimastix californiae]|eukprot:ORY30418.1 hypothetical protein LY90DRAFT_512645 [Neocallimastix californiae]
MVEDNSEIINFVAVKRAMIEGYYQIWSMNMGPLLEEKELDINIHEKRIKIVSVPEDRMNDNNKIRGTTDMYYRENIKKTHSTSDDSEIEETDQIKDVIQQQLSDIIKVKITKQPLVKSNMLMKSPTTLLKKCSTQIQSISKTV